MEKYKNTSFIIADSYNNIKKLQLEPWYLNNVNKNAGIWIGEGIGSQSAINFKSMSMEVRRLSFSDMAFVTDKNNALPIRKVIMEEKNDEK